MADQPAPIRPLSASKKVPLMTDSHTAIPKELPKNTTPTSKPQSEKIDFQNPFSVMNRNNLPPLTKKPQPPSQDIPTNKSFYSDQVVASSKFRLKSHGRPDAEMQPSMLWQSNTIKNIPKTHLMSSEPSNLVKKSKLAAIGKTTQDLRITDFKPESYKPKVQIQNTVPPGQKPRRVKVERDRREFEINKASDLAKLLTSVGVTEKDLLPPAAYNNLYRPKYRVVLDRCAFF